MNIGQDRIWVRRIDRIIRKECIEKKRKGIIHARSYERARKIFALSEHKDLLVIHDSKHTRDTVRQFKESTTPCVLLSPAVGTGHDFPMDECRFQIIAKVPFIDSRPAIIRARVKSDRFYLDHVTLQELIQMCGRGVRSDRDFCVTYIIDDNFGDWFWPRNRKHAPRWFRAGVRRINSLDEVA
jgi:Rad3-related DNA helicase